LPKRAAAIGFDLARFGHELQESLADERGALLGIIERQRERTGDEV